MEDLNVIDMAFLNGHSTQSIGTLSMVYLTYLFKLFIFNLFFIKIIKDSANKLTFKCYELDYNSNKDLNNLLWYKELSDNQAFLIPGMLYSKICIILIFTNILTKIST
jgi:hypothetical protein